MSRGRRSGRRTDRPGSAVGRVGKILLILLVLYAVFLILFPFFEDRLIYFPDPTLLAKPSDFGLAYEDVWLTAEDSTRLHAWYLHPSEEPPEAYVLFLHGNAGNVSFFLEKTAALAKQGLAVLSLDYRGFGLSQGRPNEKGTYLDAAAGYKWLASRPGVTPDRLVIFGYSLGGAVAAELALSFPARALILESTFTSIRDMGREVMPFIPRFLVSPKYETLSKIPRLKMPIFFIHGENDDVVPPAMGQRLYDAYPGPKEQLVVKGAGHTDVDLVGGEAYLRSIEDFILHPPGQ